MEANSKNQNLNNAKLNEILSLFSVESVKWSELDGKYQKNEKNEQYLEGDNTKLFYTCSLEKIPGIQRIVGAKNSYITGQQLSYGENNLPPDISILVKVSKDYQITKEVIASQILNYFGCETAFYFSAPGTKFNPHNSISIDFIAPSEEFYTLEHLKFNEIFEIKDTLAEFDPKCRTSFCPMPPVLSKATTKQREKLKRSFVRAYLVRTILLRDTDNVNFNQGILINQKARNYTFISFDFEHAFTKDRLQREHRLSIKQAMKLYPDIYTEVYQQAMEVKKILDKIPVSSKKPVGEIIKIFKESLAEFSEFHNCTVEEIEFGLERGSL